MTPLYTDTTCNKDVGITTWEGMYSLLEEEDPKVMEAMATVGSHGSSTSSITDLACSFLHRIAARPIILTYKDMEYQIMLISHIENLKLRTKNV